MNRNGTRWPILDRIWFWLVASNVFFLLVYLAWGLWDVARIPSR